MDVAYFVVVKSPIYGIIRVAGKVQLWIIITRLILPICSSNSWTIGTGVVPGEGILAKVPWNEEDTK